MPEQETRAATSTHTRTLAVQIHSALCPRDHLIRECDWRDSPDYDDPDRAEWNSNEAHAYWLKVTETAIGKARELGFTVTEPGGT